MKYLPYFILALVLSLAIVTGALVKNGFFGENIKLPKAINESYDIGGDVFEFGFNAATQLVGALGSGIKEAAITLTEKTFKLNKINIIGLELLDEEYIKNVAQLKSNSWIWNISLFELESELEKNVWIEEADISWEVFPLTTNISISEVTPWAVVELGEKSWLLSDSGKLLQELGTLSQPEAIVESATLPRISGISGDDEDTGFRFPHAVRMLSILREAGDFPFEVSEYRLLEHGGLLISPVEKKYPQVRLLYQSVEGAKTRLAQLREVLKDLEFREEKSAIIDLQFENQAIVQ